MLRLLLIALALCAFCTASFAHDGGCCEHCGCKLHCQVMCEWEYRDVLRYKAEHTECKPPCCVCCDDRWIIGCPKPIKILCLKPHYEKKKYLVGQYVVRTCPECKHQDSVELPDPESREQRNSSGRLVPDKQVRRFMRYWFCRMPDDAVPAVHLRRGVFSCDNFNWDSPP